MEPPTQARGLESVPGGAYVMVSANLEIYGDRETQPDRFVCRRTDYNSDAVAVLINLHIGGYDDHDKARREITDAAEGLIDEAGARSAFG
jgi:hypothetical protein